MEIECVVCSSPNDLRALRCFVCGAELPHKPEQIGLPLDTNTNFSSFQSLIPPVKVPLSVGALPLEEMLSKRPSPSQASETQHSRDDLDILLGPEELSPSKSQSQISAKGGIRLKSDFMPAEAKVEQGKNFGNSFTASNVEVQGDIDKPSKDIPPDTWIGIPISEDKISVNQLSHLSENQQDISEESKNESIGSAYSPISQLLESHRREVLKTKQSLASVELPKEQTLTGQALKEIEQESTPSRWSMKPNHKAVNDVNSSEINVSDPNKDSNEPLVIDHEEKETALRVSIPELAAVEEQSENLHSNFVPAISLPHALKIPTELQDSSDGHEAVELRRPSSHSNLGGSQSPRTIEEAFSVPEHEQSSGLNLSPFSWFLLALTSIAVGIVGALYIVPQGNGSLTTDLKLAKITKDGTNYVIKVDIQAYPKATLVIPDSYLSAGQTSLMPVKGQERIELKVPQEFLKLGNNKLTLQWTYQDRTQNLPKFMPAELYLPLNYQQGTVTYSSDRNAYLLGLNLSPDQLLVDSSYDFEPGEQPHHYKIIVPKSSVNKEKHISVSVTLKSHKNSSGSSLQEYKLSYALPRNIVPFRILSPVKHYARPDKMLDIQGLCTPNGLVSLQSIEINSKSMEKTPKVEATANEQGLFSLQVPLKGMRVPREGLLWMITLEVIDSSGQPQTQTIQVKQSYAPKWRHYIKRLSRRKDKASQRYYHFSYKKLQAKLDKYQGKAGMISGKIVFIDRGTNEQRQRLLLHTCKQSGGCPIWIEDPQAFWVKVGEKVSAFGVLVGQGEYLNHKREKLSAPEIRARLTTP